MSESLARKSVRVLREEGLFVLLKKGFRRFVVLNLLNLRLVYGVFGSIGWFLSEARRRNRAAIYRRRHDIADSFDFPKEGAHLSGDGTITIGGGGHIGANSKLDAYEGTEITIGRNVHIGSNVHLYTANYDSRANLDRPGYQIERNVGDVVIGNGVWLGDNVVIRPGTEIGNGVIVGANAVVTDDIPDGTVVGGVPARELRSRGYSR